MPNSLQYFSLWRRHLDREFLAVWDFACLHALDEPVEIHNVWLLLEIFDVLKLFALVKVFFVKDYQMSGAIVFELSLETVELDQLTKDDVICNV